MNSKITDKILVILGPTSSGKSDIAIRLAKQFDGEIISADSRQIYRGMGIGTGCVRLTRNKKGDTFSEGVRHHMLDIVSPRTDYNVAKFKKQSENIIDDILKREKLPVICGGTGFWIQAIVDNVDFPEVKPDWQLRKKLDKYSAEKLFSMLSKIDPERSENIDRKNKVRLIRAIEICKHAGRVPALSNLKFATRNSEKKNPNYGFLQIGIKLSKEQLYRNIKNRLKARFRQGMVAEVKKLHEAGLSWKKIQSFGLGYSWIPLFVQGKLSRHDLIENIMNAEKNYAKRQMTWFKRDKRIRWLENYKMIENKVKIFLK